MGVGKIIITREILRHIDYSFSIGRRISPSCPCIACRASCAAGIELMGITTADFSTAHRPKEGSNTWN